MCKCLYTQRKTIQNSVCKYCTLIGKKINPAVMVFAAGSRLGSGPHRGECCSGCGTSSCHSSPRGRGSCSCRGARALVTKGARAAKCFWMERYPTYSNIATCGNMMQYVFLAGFHFRSGCVGCTCAAWALIDLSTLPVLVKGLCSASIVWLILQFSSLWLCRADLVLHRPLIRRLLMKMKQPRLPGWRPWPQQLKQPKLKCIRPGRQALGAGNATDSVGFHIKTQFFTGLWFTYLVFLALAAASRVETPTI